MIFKKQTKVSENFGPDYIEDIVTLLEEHFSISLKDVNKIEMDLTYFNYNIDGDNISFISEGMIGTSILGKNSLVKKVIKFVKAKKPEMFECLI